MGKLRTELRSEMRRILTNLDPRWVKAASLEVCAGLRSLFQETGGSIKHVLAWTSFFPGEIDLSRFIAEQLTERRVYLPRVLPEGGMQFINVGVDWHALSAPGAFGIPEPYGGMGEPFAKADPLSVAVLVPGLAFDTEGDRLGRGKGYYDRFLAREEMQGALRIGVCWSMQLVSDIPKQQHDMPVDWICNERGYARCLPLKGGR